MNCAVLTLALLAPPVADPVMTSSTTSLRSYLRSSFDTRWVLPTSEDWAALGTEDLPARARRLAAARFPSRSGEPDAPEADLSLGDAVARLFEVRGDRPAIDRLLRTLRRESPALSRDAGLLLEQLARTASLDGGDWDPDEDAEDDGIFLAASLDLSRVDAPPWNDLDGSSALEQACCLMRADVDAIKAAEGAYPDYPDDVGAAYLAVHPVAGSLVVGEDEDDGPFQGLRVFSKADLPFPFTSYDCELRLLTRVGVEGLVVTDLHATNDDFLWLAGRDVYVPLESSDGAFVAMLVVRQFGFDLAGVPDGDGDRQAATRGTLGNLRLRAERAYRAAEGTPRILRGELPVPRVRGAQ